MRRWLILVGILDLLLVAVMATVSGSTTYRSLTRQVILDAEMIGEVVYPFTQSQQVNEMHRSLSKLATRLDPAYVLVVSNDRGIEYSYPRYELYHQQLPAEWAAPAESDGVHLRRLRGQLYLETWAPIKGSQMGETYKFGYVVYGESLWRVLSPLAVHVGSLVAVGLFCALVVVGLVYWNRREFERSFTVFRQRITEIATGQFSMIDEATSRDDGWRRLIVEVNSILSKSIETERELAESQKLAALAKLTQMVAHDVRRPFSLMDGLLKMLATVETAEDAKKIAREKSATVRRAAASVKAMLADIMDFDGSRNLAKEVVSVRHVISEALADSVGLEQNARATVEVDLKHESMGFIDAARVGRVFSNVLVNALQATRGEGRLWVKSHNISRDWIHVTIGNSGSYIADADRTRLFEAFFTKGKKDGTGLGLAIAKRIVDMHGGKIWCTSSREVGTEFHFVLPAAGERDPIQMVKDVVVLPEVRPSDSQRTNHTPTMDVEKPLVAVVDDNPLVVDAWETLVKDATIVGFSRPTDLLTDIEANGAQRFAAIVVDWHFDEDGQPDGPSLCKDLRQQYAGLIFLSSDDDSDISDLNNIITGRIEKREHSFAELERLRGGEAEAIAAVQESRQLELAATRRSPSRRGAIGD